MATQSILQRWNHSTTTAFALLRPRTRQGLLSASDGTQIPYLSDEHVC